MLLIDDFLSSKLNVQQHVDKIFEDITFLRTPYPFGEEWLNLYWTKLRK